MWTNQLHLLVQYLHVHPHIAGIIVFLTAFLEALAVVGTIVPGSVTLTAIGTLVGSRVMPLGSTLVLAMIGAVLGDLLSYLIGLHYKDRIHKIWPFTKYPKWLATGEDFFRRHGGKSIIIGRFFGPGRSLVPLIAGSFNMSFWRFIFAAVPSASVWAVSYMLPGIFLGALSLEFPKELAIEFIVFILAILLIGVLVFWMVKYFCWLLHTKIDGKTIECWHYMRNNKRWYWFTELLTNPRNPENHSQLLLVFYALICSALLLLLMVNVSNHGILTAINLPLFNFFTSLRGGTIDNIAVFFTIIGDFKVMLGGFAVIAIWFWWRGHYRTVFHLGLTAALVAVTTQFLKHIIAYPRPELLNHAVSYNSFPSGHTTVTMAFLGLLAAIIAPELKPGRRFFPYLLAVIITVAVGLSRLFLGAHWLTDVIGGLLLGITLALLVTISYRRTHTPFIPVLKYSLIIPLCLALVWTLFCYHEFKITKNYFSIEWPISTISYSNWQQSPKQYVPYYRANRFGKPIEAFNIEWLGDVAMIKKKLAEQEWQEHDTDITFTGIIKRLVGSQTEEYHLPLIPQVYHQQYPALIATKIVETDDQDKKIIVLRLWASDITISDSKYPLWLGVVNYYHPPEKAMVGQIPLKNNKTFNGATDKFVTFLKGFSWREIVYDKAEVVAAVQKIQWDGKILIVVPRI